MSVERSHVCNPHGLTDKARLRLHLRYAFHDWMWSGGTKDECGWLRRIARRLPIYFTDPYLDGMPKSREEFDALSPEPTVGPPPLLTNSLTFDHTTGRVYPTPQTYTTTTRLPDIGYTSPVTS